MLDDEVGAPNALLNEAAGFAAEDPKGLAEDVPALLPNGLAAGADCVLTVGGEEKTDPGFVPSAGLPKEEGLELAAAGFGSPRKNGGSFFAPSGGMVGYFEGTGKDEVAGLLVGKGRESSSALTTT